MAIGSRIVERLDALKWRRNDLLERVDNLTPQALSNLIRRDSVRSEWDEPIAKALGVSVMWLVYGRDDYPAATSDNVVTLAKEPDTADLITQLVRGMSPQGQWVALGAVQTLAKQYPAAAVKPGSS